MLRNAAILLEDFASEGLCLAFAWCFRLAVQAIYGPTEVMFFILLRVDDVMVLGIILWLIYQLAIKLWNQRVRVGGLNAFMVA